jgi:TATA-box binding protein (TBP) (component of TFIID and TFIIIB)
LGVHDDSWRHPDIHVRVPGQPKNRKSPFRRFHNALSCVFTIEGVRVVAKFFLTNGTIHLTGSKSCAHALAAMAFLADALDVHMRPETFRIQLINIVWKSPDFRDSGVSLHELQKHVSGIYDPDTYVGLKVRRPGCTLLCFTSATVIVSGVKDAPGLAAAHEALTTLAAAFPYAALS